MPGIIPYQLQYSLRKESGDFYFQWGGYFTIDLRKHVMQRCRQKHLHHRREKCEVEYDFFLVVLLKSRQRFPRKDVCFRD